MALTSITAPANINTAVGSAFNYASAGASVFNSVRSLFGVTPEAGPQNISSINRLRSELTKTDIMSTNLFYVTISGLSSSASQTLSLLCHQTSLPGVSFGSSETRRYGYGPVEKKPTFPIFTDLSMTFIGDGRGAVHKMFYNWMNTMVRFDSPTAAAWGPAATGSMFNSTSLPYEVAYKDNYSTTITITAVDRANQEIIVIDLLEAYPFAMGDISLSWSDTDSLMNIPVTFTFINWKYQRIDVSEILRGGGSEGLFNKLVKVGTAIQTLSTISKPKSIGDIVNVTNMGTMAINGLKGMF